MRLPKRSTSGSADLRTIQVVEGDEGEVTGIVTALRRAGCVVESVVDLGRGKWEITARSDD